MARARSRAKLFLQLLEGSSDPIYVLDGNRVLVYANEACAEWLDVVLDDLLGTRFDYSAATEAQSQAALCPPPELLLGALPREQFEVDNGKGDYRGAQAITLARHQDDPAAVLVRVFSDQSSELPSVDLPEAAELHQVLRRAVLRQRDRFHPGRLVGESPAMQRVRDQVAIAVSTGARTVIVGPRGAGREHVARTIHGGCAPEEAGPLMPLSADVLDGELLQTTVLAFMRRCQEMGCQRQATVLFLDVDQLGSEAQAELLALVRLPTIDLRTIATSRTPLQERTALGSFDAELEFALTTLLIELPALEDRRQDIPLLVQHFIEDENQAGQKQISGFEAEAIDTLTAMPWRGDVAELAEIVQQAYLAADGPWVRVSDLPERVRILESAAEHPRAEPEQIELDAFLEEVECELLERALSRSNGNKAQAARLLGISRPRLLRRLEHFGRRAKFELP